MASSLWPGLEQENGSRTIRGVGRNKGEDLQAGNEEAGSRARGRWEALLGWLNCTVLFSAKKAFDANRFLKELAGEVQTRLRAEGAEVAHLKMTLRPEGGLGQIGVVNLVRNDYMSELSMLLEEPSASCRRGPMSSAQSRPGPDGIRCHVASRTCLMNYQAKEWSDSPL